LEQHGFFAVRQKGSHRVLQKHTANGTVSVPVPLHDPVRRGTLLTIIRQSGLSRTLFETEK
jgi:predicted RNA binding protein YcfA (HicA-like mRNA interferase family)